MNQFNSEIFLDTLSDKVRDILVEIRQITHQQSEKLLLAAPASDKWSIAQIVEHLNSYNRYYLPAIEKAILKEQASSINREFKPGWIGGYFTKLMQPGKDGQVVNKMQAPKDHRPVVQLDINKVLDEFLKGEERLLSLLQEARKKDIGRIRVPISLTKLIRLKLGDTFSFLVAHQDRHRVQILNSLKIISDFESPVKLS